MPASSLLLERDPILVLVGGAFDGGLGGIGGFDEVLSDPGLAVVAADAEALAAFVLVLPDQKIVPVTPVLGPEMMRTRLPLSTMASFEVGCEETAVGPVPTGFGKRPQTRATGERAGKPDPVPDAPGVYRADRRCGTVSRPDPRSNSHSLACRPPCAPSSASIVPACASTICLTSIKPSPSPPVVRARLARKKGSKSRARASGVTPGPVSSTENQIWSRSSDARKKTVQLGGVCGPRWRAG